MRPLRNQSCLDIYLLAISAVSKGQGVKAHPVSFCLNIPPDRPVSLPCMTEVSV